MREEYIFPNKQSSSEILAGSLEFMFETPEK